MLDIIKIIDRHRTKILGEIKDYNEKRSSNSRGELLAKLSAINEVRQSIIDEGTAPESPSAKDARKIIDHFNITFFGDNKGKYKRYTSSVMTKIITRLKMFSLDEIKSAIENRKHYVDYSDWHNKPENIQHKESLEIIVRDDAKLEKELNRKYTHDKSKKPIERESDFNDKMFE